MTEHPPTETARHPAHGRVLAGRYALLGELGRGGMGVVWRAEDTVIGRHVAIKELRLPEGGEGAEVFAERVLREVRTGGRLNDPAVVTVYDVVNDGNATYIVMELVEAPTLSDLVRERGALSSDLVAAVGEQVLSALTAAHRAGIVHRDVKPGNIMVGANGRVKLTDFGIAQPVDDPRLTTSGFLVGSPAFMAPERIAGKDAVPASDLWSLGATLYFAAEGTVAFERGSTAATLHAIMNEVPYLTRTQGPLASVIMGMLISTPDARITAEQATGLLQMARTGIGMPTPPGGHTAMYPGGQNNPPTRFASDPRIPQPRARPGKGWALVGGAVLGVLLLVGGFFLGHWLAAPSASQRDETWTRGTGGQIPEFAVDHGECATGQLAEGRSFTSSDCSQAHDLQVFGVAAPFADDSAADFTYPGDRLTAWAEARCSMTFESALMNATLRDSLRYRALIPSEAAWKETDESGNRMRSVFCVAYDAEGKQLTESVLVTE
ncbi:MAG: serine/threonine-protein kinase [Thermocrispum sp.]